MKEEIKGLSRYNPLCISDNNITRNGFCAEFTLYNVRNQDLLFYFNIPKLLEERQMIMKLYSKAKEGATLETYSIKFKELLANLSSLIGKSDEIFWDNMYVLEQIILKDSIIKECRALITQNLQAISQILAEAQKRESALKKSASNSISKYAILSFYVTNKFKTESDIDDDALFEFLIGKFFDKNNFNLELFINLSMYKNCDRFDLSWQDIVDEFRDMNSCVIDYSWIFIPYLQRYCRQFEELMLKSVGDDIYDMWFSYLLSKDYLNDTMSETDSFVKNECKEAIEAFTNAGIYTYEYNKLIGQIMKERKIL